MMLEASLETHTFGTVRTRLWSGHRIRLFQ